MISIAPTPLKKRSFTCVTLPRCLIRFSSGRVRAHLLRTSISRWVAYYNKDIHVNVNDSTFR